MSLHSLFAPKSIAVIGASTTKGSVGNDIAKNLLKSDFAGKVYPVNPKAETLYGVRCYASVADISGSIDLAIVVVPAKIVPQVLWEAGEKMIRSAIIISAGFKETGPDGQALEKEIQEIAKEYSMTLLGPNCLGFIAPRLFLNASFASASPKAGPIAFFSQSGALMSALLDHAKEYLGFSAFVSIGNKVVIGERELLKHFHEDPATTVIGMYTEGLTDAPHFIQTGRQLLRGKKPKPVIVLKSGQTEAGTAASSSHTGALAGSAAAYRALFRQARMLQAESFEELLDLLTVFSKNPLPQGKKIAIVTNAGGLGVLATDAAVSSGLELATFSEKTITTLQTFLPPAANVHNPVDVLGDALGDRYAHALSVVAADKNVDLLLVVLTPQTMTEPGKTAKAIVHVRKVKPELPLVAVFAGHDLVAPGVKVLNHADIAVLGFPEAGARALGRLAQVAEWKRMEDPKEMFTFKDIKKEKVKELFEKARTEKTLQIGEVGASEVLQQYGFPFLESHLARSPEEALALARKIGKPIALKIVSPDIIHKSDVGGVILDVHPEEAAHAYEHMLGNIKEKAPEAHIDGALVVEMAQPGGIEILLGLKKEPGLGTLLVFGLGGITVEILHDVSMRFVPLSSSDIDEMLEEIQAAELLTGARGKAGIDREKLKEYIARLAEFATDFPEVVELDINPLLAFPNAPAFRILDARIRLSE
ncbi:MAG: acetate--CoA ligase family protein [Candidatus Moraniibacteriota bacterium]